MRAQADRAVQDGLPGGHQRGLDDEHYEPFVATIDLLLRPAAADGSLNQGIVPEDVLLQLSVLWRIRPGEDGATRAARILALVVDGLRPPAP